jgi:hypothetical protein
MIKVKLFFWKINNYSIGISIKNLNLSRIKKLYPLKIFNIKLIKSIHLLFYLQRPIKVFNLLEIYNI